MKTAVTLVALYALVSCSSSGGTETGNPAILSSFDSSSCKSKAPTPGAQALLAQDDTEGLECIEWSREPDGLLRLRLSNVRQGCADGYQGKAELSTAGALDLTLYSSVCAVAACGWCLFDFEAKLRDIPTDEALPLRIGRAVCETEPTTWSEPVSLPLDQSSEGVICRFADRWALRQYAAQRGRCGERNMPCGACDAEAGPGACAENLVCSEVASNDWRCLTSCESDADCIANVTSCDAGVCRASADFDQPGGTP